MRVEVRRSPRGTVSAVINLALAWVTAVVVIGNQIVRAEASVAWIITGVLLGLWGAIILSGLVRPVKLVVQDTGLIVTRLFGPAHFAWDELTIADFDRSEKLVMISAKVAGRDRYAALSKRGIDERALAAARDVISRHRPDLTPAVIRAPKGETQA